MFCPNCGTKNDDDALFCAACGTRLEVPGTAAPAPAPVAEPAPAPVVEPAPAPVVEPAPAPVVEPAPAPVVEPAPAPVVEPAPAPVVEPVPAPVAEPAPEPVVEPAPAPVAEPAPSPVVPDPIPNTAEPIGVTVAAPAPEPVPAATPVVEPVPVAAPVEAPQAAPIPQASSVAPQANTVPQAAPIPQAASIPQAAPVNQAQPTGNTVNGESKPKSKIKPWMFIAGGGALLLIIAIVVGVIIAATKLGGGSGKVTGSFNTFYDPAEDITYIFYNEKNFKNWFEGEVYIVQQNDDNTVALLMDDQDTLYYATSTYKMDIVDSDVKSSRYTLSSDGSTIAYLDNDNTLYTYNIKNGRKNTVAYDVSTTPVLSPTGKALLFNIEDDGDDTLYAYNGRKDYKLTRDVLPIAISDDMRYIYYADPEKQAIYITDRNSNSNKISGDLDDYNFTFNNDLSQILFTTDSGLYISERGRDKVKLSGSYSGIDLVTAMSGYQGRGYNTVFSDNINGYALSFHYPIATFANQVCYGYADDSYEAFRITRDWQCEKFVGGMDYFMVDKNASVLYYLSSDNSLYRVRLGAKAITDKIKDDVYEFTISSSGAEVYFIDEDDALYIQKGNGKPRKIADDVTSLGITYDGVLLYFTEYDGYTGELYYYKGGRKKLLSDEANFFRPEMGVTFYGANGDIDKGTNDIYVTKKGVAFTLILQEVY